MSSLKIIIISVFVLFVYSCTEYILPPRIITGEVTNIDEDGALFHAKVISLGNAQIAEFGFVWDTVAQPTVNTAEKFSILKKVSVGNFDEKISVNLIKNKLYYVRAFIRTTEDVSYGEETKFTSLGGKLPEITTISPKMGNLTDTLILIGKYFSARSSVVRINHIEAQVIRSNQDSILVRIPSNLNKKTSEILLSNLNQNITAKDSFTLISPIISSFENKQLTYGDEITIKGDNFYSSPSSIKVYFDSINAAFTLIDNQTIKAIAPNSLEKPGFIKVVMNNLEAVSSDKYSLLPFEFYDFNPKIATTGSTITISGKNFSPVLKNNIVYIGGVKSKSINVTKNSLEVFLPLQDSVIYQSRNASVVVSIFDANYTRNPSLLINDKWFRRANAPLQLINQRSTTWYDYKYASSFIIGKTAYIGLNDKKEFWAYDTENNTWKKRADFPGTPRIYGTGFVFDNKIYFGTGVVDINTTSSTNLSDWWEYDPSSDRWTQKASFIGGGLSTLAGYSTSTGCYVSNGFTKNQNAGYTVDIWKYNPISDVWNKEIIDLKGLIAYPSNWKLTNVVDDDVYICFLNSYYDSYPSTYVFNTQSNTFTAIKNFPYTVYSQQEAVSFVINNRIYVRTPYQNFYYYDRTNNTWKFTETIIYSGIYTEIAYGIGFAVGNIGFVGMGQNNLLYEFDPAR